MFASLFQNINNGPLLGILLDEIVTPAVGNPNITDSVGFVQSFGNALSCMFSDGTCDIASNSDSSACKGWFFVKVGNTIRDIYKCLRVIIVDGIGFWEDLFGGQTSNLGNRIKNIIVDGIWCLIETLITDLLDLIVTYALFLLLRVRYSVSQFSPLH